MFTDRHCYGNFTDRHCYRIIRRQTLLQKCSSRNTATVFVPLEAHSQNWSRKDTLTRCITYRHWHTIGYLRKSEQNWSLKKKKYCLKISHLRTLGQNWSPTATATETNTYKRCHWFCVGNSISLQTLIYTHRLISSECSALITLTVKTLYCFNI
jgi:hypothetical protein